MRMHPRKFGTYSIVAKFSSALVNEIHKNQKKEEKYSVYNNSNNEATDGSIGCIIFMLFGLLFVFGACSAIFNN